jgi:hypothetical protein
MGLKVFGDAADTHSVSTQIRRKVGQELKKNPRWMIVGLTSAFVIAFATAVAVGWERGKPHTDSDGDVWTYCGAKNPIYSEYINGTKHFWVLDRCLKGVPGAAGAPGPQGPIGPAGPQGSAGVNGVPGSSAKTLEVPNLRFRPMTIGPYKCTFFQRGRDVFPTCILRRAASFTPPVAG